MKQEIATLAGGCFWGMEELFRALPGVISTDVGYTGGTLPNPTYEQICTGQTGHAEALQIVFDPERISFGEILRRFFQVHDPTSLNRQGNDLGTQYRSAIFVHSESQRQAAEAMIQRVNASGFWKKPVVTHVEAASEFYVAEGYHQDYLQKHPNGYTCHFRRAYEF